jgi:hypothetical protein
LKREPIREADISAHGLAFHVIMEPLCAEEDFGVFCDDLQYAIATYCDAEKAAKLHQGNGGYFLIDYDDGLFHDVDYDPRGGILLVKQVMHFEPPTELSGARSPTRTAAEDVGAFGRKKRSTGRRISRMQ